MFGEDWEDLLKEYSHDFRIPIEELLDHMITELQGILRAAGFQLERSYSSAPPNLDDKRSRIVRLMQMVVLHGGGAATGSCHQKMDY